MADTTHDDLTWLRRTRSAVLLVGLVVVLGVAVVGGASLLDHALG